MFSPDGTLISASAAPHCGGQLQRIILGLRETFIKRHKGNRTNRAEIRPDEQSEKEKSLSGRFME